MNYADLTDEELDAALAETSSTPPLFRRHDMRALQAERDRRAPKPPTSWSMPENVESDLDAAAAPLTPDPVVKPKVIVPPKPSPRDAYRQSLDEAGWEEDEADLIMRREGGLPGAYANTPDPDRERQNAADWHRTEAAHGRREDFWKDAYGHNYTGPVQQGDTVMVDGRELPAVMGSDGLPLGAGTDRQYYRLRDLKAAERAEAEAAASAALRAQREQENATYGHYSLRDGDPQLTEAQSQARSDRKAAEEKASELRAKRAKTFAPFKQKEDERRAKVAAMAALAGGSQNLNAGNRSMYYALSLLEPEEQGRALMQMMPMDPVRAQVEARQLDMAGRMAQNAVTAFLTNNPGANGGQAMRDIAQAQAESQLPSEVQAERHRQDPNVHPSEITAADAYVSQMYSSPGWYFGGGNSSEFTIQEQNDTINHLVNDLGYDPAKAQKIVDEIARRRHQSSAFGNPTRDAQPSPAAPPAPPGPARNPAGPGRPID